MGLRDILRRIILAPAQREQLERKNLSMAMEDYQFLTGKKLSSKERKTANKEMDQYMKERGYRPMHRRISRIQRKKRKLKVGQSQAVGRTSRIK